MPPTKPPVPAASLTIPQLLQGSAWFPLLDVGAGERVLDEMREVEVAAGVVWYGFPPLEYIDASKIKVPVLGHWATQDEFFPAETVDALEAKLIAANVDVEFHRYLALHSFANETAVGPGRISRTQFDPVWAQRAWDRTLTFFGRTLWK